MVFGSIVRPSRDVRNAGFGKAMTDPRMQPGATPMPFEGRHMISGGFERVAGS